MEALREIGSERWPEYFDWLSEELLNASVSIDIVAAGEPPSVQAKGLALQTLAYDARSDVFEIAAARGGPHLPSTLRHLVDHPRRVLVDNDVRLAPVKIAVEARDGSRTLIEIKRAAEFGG